MSVPQVREQFRDGGLSGGALALRKCLTLGVALGGPLAVVTSVAEGNAESTFVGGPLCEALASKLVEAGGPQLGYRMAATVAGAIGFPVPYGNDAAALSAVTHTGTGTAIGTVSGSNTEPVSVVMKVTVGGLNLAASPKGRFSLDGGITYGSEVTLLASQLVPDTGVTFLLADGSFVVNDLYRFTAAPGVPLGDGSAAVGLAAGSTTPADAFEVVVEITRAGVTLAAATAAFRYSLDGGDTFSPEIAVPTGGTYVLPDTGLAITFSNGAGNAFVAGDSLAVQTSAPGFTLGELQAALAAIGAGADEWEFVHVVGTATAATAAGVATTMTTLEGLHQFSWAMLEARPRAPGETISAYETDLAAAFSALVGERVAIAAGTAEMTSPVTGRLERRHAAWLAAARIIRIPIGQDAAWVGFGPFSRLQVASIDYDANAHDALDTARFITLRTFKGKRGFYVTNAFTFAAEDSDYHYLVARRVLDEAARNVRPTALNYLSSAQRLNTSEARSPLVPGAIYEPAARMIDATLRQIAIAAVVATGQATEASVTVSRTTVLSVVPAPEIPVEVLVTPLGYFRGIVLRMGFRNPNAGR